MTSNIKVGAIILAAGYSSRMKTPKPLLSFDSNVTFIQKIVSTYLTWGCNMVTIVINRELLKHSFFSDPPEKCTIVVNEHPEYERFYSVKLGSQQMQAFEYCFLQDADNPFTTNDTLDELFLNKDSRSVIVPSFQGKGGHPILLGNTPIKLIATHETDSGNLKEILKQVTSKKIEMNDVSVLININTPEEYLKYFKL